jgi:sterol-4alpha-carboxylate 3-dehydrogenase (decarboxylating)
MIQFKHRIQIDDNNAKSDHTSGETRHSLTSLLPRPCLPRSKILQPMVRRLVEKPSSQTGGQSSPRALHAWSGWWQPAGDHTLPEDIKVILAWFILNLTYTQSCKFHRVDVFDLPPRDRKPLTFRRALLDAACVERERSQLGKRWRDLGTAQ